MLDSIEENIILRNVRTCSKIAECPIKQLHKVLDLVRDSCTSNVRIFIAIEKANGRDENATLERPLVPYSYRRAFDVCGRLTIV